ncbi:Methyltransferase-like protein 14 homolog [Babesia bigemina]|uniref:Methyltransferase-like protein 14 homolog n=1 Tax=Babesia bigemina TaxID=5866 RepID=A0A061D4W2_BABBI|nr:Methyltransferase-like protein 14 homolog [Babesia bigemina]CDR95736.1 Methyltransferase-like protein 14 homolog [Babesia bigemina]|eukprot:XP_012767922.1 Methyltransferase-like protein 14 homolog [Babesia bigemina]
MVDSDGKDGAGNLPPVLPFAPMMMNMMPGPMMPPFPMGVPFPAGMMPGAVPVGIKKRGRSRRKNDAFGRRTGDSTSGAKDHEEGRQDGKRGEKRSFISTRGRERIQNDYNQRFVETGERPQNFVRDVGEGKRFGEYPKLDRLSNLKREIITKRATPARHIRADLRTFDFDSLRVLFDVVLINPPWRTFKMREMNQNFGWTLEDLIEHVPVDKIVDAMSFCFIWCDSYTLDDARNALRHWGFRKCEDICWLKTNANWSSLDPYGDTTSKVRDLDSIHPPALLHKTTERCLVGLRGPVRRNEDDYFVHSNLDTDVIISEERDPRERLRMELELQLDEGENMQMQMDTYLTNLNPKPHEIFDIIDRFCLGRRKIELFGSDSSIRNGWVTVGPAVSTTNYNADEFLKWTSGSGCWPQIQDYRGGRLMGTSEEIENLRPKSPAKLSGKDASELRDAIV